MLSDHHEPSPESSVADDDHQDELSSIGHSSLLAPPMSHRQLHPYTNPQPDRQRLHSPPVESQVAPLDPSSLTFVTTGIHRPLAASSGPLRTITHSDHPHDISLPNPNPLSPHPSWFHRPQTPPPQGPVLFSDGYAPAESLPPQHYIPPARTVPPRPPPPIINATPIYPPLSHGTSFLSLTLGGAAPPVAGIPSPSAIVPPNSELARPPRFTFAPPGAIVPADTVVSATPTPSGSATPTCSRKRDKAKGKLLLDRDRASQPTQEGSSGRRARSNSWSVVSSVFRRRSGGL
ncbi:hypothetical protein B0F90DRAFT_1759697 [Multifurca ochricompacta]|uniref:Uncharacterized protein n=1 Tax=Multifurca ochricompacta TaxID=376703 RepID=A0AAD4QJ47_9AGAM|nr:hypothetical protein B0F90DRAFT_1759697 [Multifurca ochricompacta]